MFTSHYGSTKLEHQNFEPFHNCEVGNQRSCDYLGSARMNIVIVNLHIILIDRTQRMKSHIHSSIPVFLLRMTHVISSTAENDGLKMKSCTIRKKPLCSENIQKKVDEVRFLCKWTRLLDTIVDVILPFRRNHTPLCLSLRHFNFFDA